jgi:hypothetical protein
MPTLHSSCLGCETGLPAEDSQAEPIVDACPVRGLLLEAVGDLGGIDGYRAVETGGSGSQIGAPLRARADGARWARSSLTSMHGFSSESNARARSVRSRVSAVGSRAPGTGRRGREMPPPRSSSVAPPRLSPVLQVFDAGGHRRERSRQTKVRTSSWVAGSANDVARLSHLAKYETRRECQRNFKGLKRSRV